VQATIRLPRDLDQITDFRHEVDRDLAEIGVAEGGRADVGLVLSEVCTNVVSHSAQGDQYDIEVHLKGSQCVIDVRNAAARHREVPSDNVLSRSGHGLQIVAAVAEDIQVHDDEEHPGLVRRVAVTLR
jgi:anti-sigma regulatory factor (Ser/Thr protein kinase)